MASRIRKNDTVYVRSGRDKGRTGRVLRVYPGDDKALVEGVNIVRRHERARSQTQAGGIVSKEAPIALCKLMVVDPKTNEPGRIRVEIRKDEKVRIHAKTGNVI